jgi:dienelactone hydrolase
LLLLAHLCASGTVQAKGEVTVEALKNKVFKTELQMEELRYKNESYSGELMSYQSDGLKVFTLVNRPTSAVPYTGFPVLIFGHGFHPEPEKYGVSEDGKTSRPGDYYRGIPESYAQAGFLTLTPDYRGHNRSEGFEFTKKSYLASSYYASDVLHLLSALPSLEDADLNRIYYLGHSMGGDVGLKVLLANTQIKAASLWSPVAATTNQQAMYYGKYYDELYSPGDAQVNSATLSEYTHKIERIYSELPETVRSDQVDPVNHLQHLTTPLIVHHARGDKSVPYIWSENLIVLLNEAGKEFSFHAYDSDNHLFDEDNRSKVIKRDINFFNLHAEDR